MNRDERHDRVSEEAPRLISANKKIYGPVDPLSGGTWIAKNDQGYWGCILNGYFEDESLNSTKNAYKSRGEILPLLLAEDDPIAALKQFKSADFLSFRVLIGSADTYLLYEWNGKTFQPINFHASHQQRCFLLFSSSWQQAKVTESRIAIFKQWAEKNTHVPDDIPTFHFSTEPAPESGILMMRSYSGTKSITCLDITSEEITMRYTPVQTEALSESLRVGSK